MSIFSQISQSIWMKFGMMSQPIGLFEAQVIFKGEKSADVIL